MGSSSIMGNIDNLLSNLSVTAFRIFIIYTLLLFFYLWWKKGLTVAIVQLFSVRVLIPLLLVLTTNAISLSLVFIEPPESGVVVSVVSPNGVRSDPLSPGLHWIIPILEDVKKYPTYWQTYTMSSKPLEGQEKGDDSIRARTKDGQEVFLDCSIIFRINISQVVVVHIDWQDRYIRDLVRPIVRGFVRTQVSQFTVAEVNSEKRKDLETTLDHLLREEFEAKGFTVDQFLLRDITFSPEYAASVERKQIALEGQIEKEYEAEQLRNLAEGQADALRAIARALEENPNLLTYQYTEKLAPNIRVMLVPNNSPLILPLPDLTASGLATDTQTIPPILDAVPEQFLSVDTTSP